MLDIILHTIVLHLNQPPARILPGMQLITGNLQLTCVSDIHLGLPSSILNQVTNQLSFIWETCTLNKSFYTLKNNYKRFHLLCFI